MSEAFSAYSQTKSNIFRAICAAKIIIAKLRQSFLHETMKVKHNNQDDLLLVFYTRLLLVAESVKSKFNDFRDDLEILFNATILLLVGSISKSIVHRLKHYKEERSTLKGATPATVGKYEVKV